MVDFCFFILFLIIGFCSIYLGVLYHEKADNADFALKNDLEKEGLAYAVIGISVVALSVLMFLKFVIERGLLV